MTTQTMTLPAISTDLRDTIRYLAREIGWRNVAKQLANGPVCEAAGITPVVHTPKPTSRKVASTARTLAQVVKEAMRHTGKGSSLPIISKLLLEPDGENVRVTATNLESTWVSTGPGSINTACCVEPKPLLPAISGDTSPSLVVSGDKVEVNGSVLEAQSAEDFPPTPNMADAEEYVLPKEWAAEARRIAVASATDDSRPCLATVQYNAETGTLTAADGFRLRTVGPRDSGGILIPRLALKAIPADAHTLRVAGANAQFIGETVTVTVMLTQATFPDYTKLIPQDNEWSVDCATSDLRDALLACKPLADAAAGIVRLVGVDGMLIVSSQDGENVARREVPAQMQGAPKFAVNICYLLDATAAVGERFCFSGKSPSVPMAIDGGDYCEVIMPMFVKW